VVNPDGQSIQIEGRDRPVDELGRCMKRGPSDETRIYPRHRLGRDLFDLRVNAVPDSVEVHNHHRARSALLSAQRRNRTRPGSFASIANAPLPMPPEKTVRIAVDAEKDQERIDANGGAGQNRYSRPAPVVVSVGPAARRRCPSTPSNPGFRLVGNCSRHAVGFQVPDRGLKKQMENDGRGRSVAEASAPGRRRLIVEDFSRMWSLLGSMPLSRLK